VTEEPEFLSLDEVLEIHDDQIQHYGGDVGIRDRGLMTKNEPRIVPGKPRFLPDEFETRRELGGHFHAVGELEVITEGPCRRSGRQP
jgi:hypothetical protein